MRNRLVIFLYIKENSKIYAMSKTRKNPKTAERKSKKVERKLVKDPDTGLWVLTGPKFTKEDVARDFPDDTDRDSIIIRRSVGL